jgi:hypothetical protein
MTAAIRRIGGRGLAPQPVEQLDEFGNVAGGEQAGLAIASPKPSPGGRACGLYDPAVSYYALDLVALNGCEWRAKKDNPGPLPGDGWMLSAKGARGRPGERGPPGLSVKAIEAVDYHLVIELSDGQALHVDLKPMLERFEAERDAGAIAELANPGTTSAMEIDQRQKDVCPPGEAGQSGQEEHILVGHGDLREQFRLPSNQRAAVRVSIASVRGRQVMSDRVFAESDGWAVGSDGVQWILFRRRRWSGGAYWRPVSFVRSSRDILARCMREKGVDLATARFLLSGLPNTFDEWKATSDTCQVGQAGIQEGGAG